MSFGPIVGLEEQEEGWSQSGQELGILHHLCYSARWNDLGQLTKGPTLNYYLWLIIMLFDLWLISQLQQNTCLSVSLAGECGRRGVECPELGGEGDANVEEVMEGVMYPLPTLSRPPSEEGGRGEASRATLLTRLSISSALSSVFSFSSCINLRGICKKT